MRMRLLPTGFALALPALLLASPKESLDLVFATQQFNEAALSPDGRNVAWIEARPNADRTPTTHASIYLSDTAGGAPRRLSGDGAALCDEQGLAWSAKGDEVWAWHYRENLAAKVAQRPDIFRKVR